MSVLVCLHRDAECREQDCRENGCKFARPDRNPPMTTLDRETLVDLVTHHMHEPCEECGEAIADAILPLIAAEKKRLQDALAKVAS